MALKLKHTSVQLAPPPWETPPTQASTQLPVGSCDTGVQVTCSLFSYWSFLLRLLKGCGFVDTSLVLTDLDPLGEVIEFRNG